MVDDLKLSDGREEGSCVDHGDDQNSVSVGEGVVFLEGRAVTEYWVASFEVD